MKTITIINQYSGNKGDRAVCFYLLSELIKYPDLKIFLSTNNRNNWKNESIIIDNDINLVPWAWNVEGFNPKNRLHWEKRRFFRKILFPYLINRLIKDKKGLGFGSLFVNNEFINTINSSDIVISTGGHHLTTRFAPNLVSELFFDICTTVLLSKKIYFWSQTFGPFDFTNKNNENALIQILKSSLKIFVRDIESVNVLKNLSIDIDFYKTYETVIGLNYLISSYILPSIRKNIVGITIYNAESRSIEDYNKYCQTIAQISDWLIENSFVVKFFPHEIIDAVVDDRNCIKDIVRIINHKDQILIENRDLSTIEHLEEISKCKVFIGHKTHSIIFALTVGTPLIAISYHPKTNDFLKQYSLEMNLINESDLSLKEFKRVFDNLLSNLDFVGNKQFNDSKIIAKIISEDFKKIIEGEKQ